MRFHFALMAAMLVLGCAGLSQSGHAADAPTSNPPQIQHPKWAGAPVACLPTRAQRWGTDESKKQPCHCPPQSYCPTTDTNLKVENLQFHVDVVSNVSITSNGRVSAVINGADLAVHDAKSVFAMSQEEIYALLQPKILELTGFDVNNLPRCRGCSMTVSIVITDMPSGFDDWLNDTLKLPILLASRCCDSICPAGMIPSLTKTQVLKPRDPTEGIHMSRTDIESIINDLPALRTALQAAGGLGAQITATLDLKAATQTYLDTAPAGIDTLKTLNTNLTGFNTLLSAAKVPASIKTDFADLYGKASALGTQVDQEIDILSRPPVMITVDALTCSAIKAFPPSEDCVIEGTQITLADGTKKAVETLSLNDVVKGNQGPAKVIALNKFSQHDEFMYSINGGKAFFTAGHPVLTPLGWKSVDSTLTSIKSDAKMVGSLQIGDTLLLENGKELKVTSIEKTKIQNGVSAYNISVGGDGSYIANGFIMKGFKKLQMHY